MLSGNLVNLVFSVLDRLNRGEEAIADLTAALAADPTSVVTLLARARQLSKHGDAARALEDYVRADKLQPQDPAILFGRGLW